MNTGGHYPSSGRGIWTPDLQLMRLASYRTATIPRYWLLGTHLRDASLFCYHYTTGCSLPTGIRTQTFSLTNKNLKKKDCCMHLSDSGGNRTLVSALRGRRLDRLTTEPYSVSLPVYFYKDSAIRNRKTLFCPWVTPTGLEPVTPPWKGGDLDHLSTGPQRGSNALFELAMPEPNYSALL